jgi:hypothetical protein
VTTAEARAFVDEWAAASNALAVETFLLLSSFRGNVPDVCGKHDVSGRVDGSVPDSSARRVLAKKVVALPIVRRPDWSWHEPSATVGADVVENCLNAGRAERAFVRADARFTGIRRKGLVAVFAGRAQFEHRVLIVDSRLRLPLLAPQGLLRLRRRPLHYCAAAGRASPLS